MLRLLESETFAAWLSEQDAVVRGLVLKEIVKVRRGLTGNLKSLGKNLSEIRINHGGGFRVYCSIQGDALILICGGMKRTQKRDIKIAYDMLGDAQ